MRPTALQSSLWPSQLILDNHSTYPTRMYQINIHVQFWKFLFLEKLRSKFCDYIWPRKNISSEWLDSWAFWATQFFWKNMKIVRVRLFGRWEYLYQSYHHILIDHNFIRAYRHYRSCLNANTKKYRLIQQRGVSINSYTPYTLMGLALDFVASKYFSSATKGQSKHLMLEVH